MQGFMFCTKKYMVKNMTNKRQIYPLLTTSIVASHSVFAVVWLFFFCLFFYLAEKYIHTPGYFIYAVSLSFIGFLLVKSFSDAIYRRRLIQNGIFLTKNNIIFSTNKTSSSLKLENVLSKYDLQELVIGFFQNQISLKKTNEPILCYLKDAMIVKMEFNEQFVVASGLQRGNFILIAADNTADNVFNLLVHEMAHLILRNTEPNISQEAAHAIMYGVGLSKRAKEFWHSA